MITKQALSGAWAKFAKKIGEVLIELAATGVLAWAGKCKISSPNDGKILMTNNAETGFLGLIFGKEDATGARLQKTGTGLNVVDGDNSNYTDMHVDSLFAETSLEVYGKSKIQSGADGYIDLYDNAGTDFTGMRYGGLTSAYPMVKRNGAALDLRLADDTTYCDVTAKNVIANDDLRASDGAAATPSIRFASEAMGLYRISAGTLGIGISSTYATYFNANGTTTNNIGVQASGVASWSGRAKMDSPADGQVRITNAAQSVGFMLDGNSDGYCWVKSRAGVTANIIAANIQISQNLNAADGQSYAWISGSPEGVVTAPVGSVRLRTDGGAGTTIYVKESGTGNTGWVPLGQPHLDTVIVMPDLTASGADVQRIPVLHNGAITKIASVLEGSALVTGDCTLTVSINGTPVTDGVVTIAESGSAVGDYDSATPTAANTVSEGDVIEITVGGSNTAPNATAKVVVEITPA